MASRYLRRPQDGRLIELGPLGVHAKLSEKDTGGAFAVVEHPIEPGVLVEPHTHANEDEFSYVARGTVGARVGREEFTAEPGSWILKPRGVMHTFWNPGPEPARVVEIIAPPGFVRFFERLEPLVARDSPDAEAIGALANQFGLSFDQAWVPDLMKRYRLKTMV